MSDIESPPPMMDNIEEAAINGQPQQQEEQMEEMEPVMIGEGQSVTSALFGQVNQDMSNLNVNNAASPITIPREEPETIRVWREKNEEHLKVKDEKEAEMMVELREKAKKELNDWYKKYEEQLGKTKADNREGDKSHFVAEMGTAIEPGTEWERVHKLCDFNVKNSRNSKDMSRMRSIMLQLKQNPIQATD